MIVVKPKVGTLFSLGIFIALCLSASGYALGVWYGGAPLQWYHYVLLIVFLPIGLGLLFRLLLGYRVVKVGKEKIDVNFPSRFKSTTYKLKDIKNWKETQVKTVSGVFRELEIHFEDGRKITSSFQEHANYDKLKKYLSKKCAKLRTNA